MEEISPSYYAAGSALRQVTLRGRHFDLIPDEAIGFVSSANDNPTVHLGSDEVRWLFSIISKTKTEMVLRQDTSYSMAASYLGCIASADGSNVYWVNDTSPLP